MIKQKNDSPKECSTCQAPGISLSNTPCWSCKFGYLAMQNLKKIKKK